jgi:hypothetical protein
MIFCYDFVSLYLTDVSGSSLDVMVVQVGDDDVAVQVFLSNWRTDYSCTLIAAAIIR